MNKIGLHWWIFLGMAVGATVGAILHAHYPQEVVGDTTLYQAINAAASVFLKLLKLIVVPLVFFSLISGMLGMADLTQLGRMGVKTLVLYLSTSMLAILTGLVLVNAIRPGVGLGLSVPTKGVEKPMPDSMWDAIVGMVPDNVFKAAAETQLLGVILFALLFGIFLVGLEGERKRVLTTAIDGISDVMMRMTRFILSLAPIGIAALIARMVASTGLGVFLDMKWYVLTVFLALAVHATITLPTFLFVVTRRNPFPYLRAMVPAFITGFSTASSSGTLGVTMERAEHGGGVSNRVASFVLPLGATINMDGTALYEIVTVLFIAQLHAGLDPGFTLTLGQQALIVFLGLAVSIGAAGIPHAGLVMMVIILQAVGLPVEYTALIWAVDRPLDMCRTAVNISSDSSIAMIVAYTEGEVDTDVLWPRRDS